MMQPGRIFPEKKDCRMTRLLADYPQFQYERHYWYNVNRFGFNGKEMDNTLKGDNIINDEDSKAGTGNSYDFGARMYDPRLGRWFSRDPLSDKFPGVSAYSAFNNNPIYFIDPDGKKPTGLLPSESQSGFLLFFHYTSDIKVGGSAEVNWDEIRRWFNNNQESDLHGFYSNYDQFGTPYRVFLECLPVQWVEEQYNEAKFKWMFLGELNSYAGGMNLQLSENDKNKLQSDWNKAKSDMESLGTALEYRKAMESYKESLGIKPNEIVNAVGWTVNTILSGYAFAQSGGLIGGFVYYYSAGQTAQSYTVLWQKLTGAYDPGNQPISPFVMPFKLAGMEATGKTIESGINFSLTLISATKFFIPNQSNLQISNGFLDLSLWGIENYNNQSKK